MNGCLTNIYYLSFACIKNFCGWFWISTLLLLQPLLLLLKLCGALMLNGKVLCSVGNEMQKLTTVFFVMLWIIVKIIAIRDTNSLSLGILSQCNCLILVQKVLAPTETQTHTRIHNFKIQLEHFKKTKIHLSSQFLLALRGHSNSNLIYKITSRALQFSTLTKFSLNLIHYHLSLLILNIHFGIVYVRHTIYLLPVSLLYR